MKQKLRSILLVDDDEDCNLFHQHLIKKVGCAEQVHTALNGLEALDFLNACKEGKHAYPDLIFLDINMPKMNGWEFLDAYEKLDIHKTHKIKLVMLTSTINPDDNEKALNYDKVNDFVAKYLDSESLQEVLQEQFTDHF